MDVTPDHEWGIEQSSLSRHHRRIQAIDNINTKPQPMASRFTQSFAFHQSPESFISSRLQQFAAQNQQSTSPIIRAEILNRNVHLITSYALCKAILQSPRESADDGTQLLELADGSAVTPDTFAVGPANEQLMVAFFPPPNILLEDGEQHLKHKAVWKTAIAAVVRPSCPVAGNATRTSFIPKLQIGEPFDLYEALKTLSWDILLAIFLGLDRQGTIGSRSKGDHIKFETVERLQEEVLRGQFSLFPVPIRTPFWTSARSRGLKAVQDLGPCLNEHLGEQWSRKEECVPICPFANSVLPVELGYNSTELAEEEIVSHMRLFTSSIANKAIGSLLTAFLMNLFLWRDRNDDRSQSLARMIASQQDKLARQVMLKSILQETIRLSPPVIGVMRRVTQPVRIRTGGDGEDHIIPAGHDAWLYFSAASRDPSVFNNANTFQWDRFMAQLDGFSEQGGFAFGGGAKKCLGAELVEQICLMVAETIIDDGFELDGKVEEEGVEAWLGWKADGSGGTEAMARDLKQLPCQRPRKAIMVTGRRKPDEPTQ